MNPMLDVLLRRKSIRAYVDRPILPSEKELIYQAALRAPTAGNMALYSIIEVEDQALKDRLAVTCDDQPFIAKAPLVLLFLADYQRWYDYYLACGVPKLCEINGTEMRRPAEGDLLLACCDALIAAHTAVIAAESLGIGSCYIGDILERYEIHRQMFALPQYVLPVTLVCFGYPTPEQAARKQTPRFDLQYIIHRDTYRRLDDHALHDWMRERSAVFAAGKRPEGVENLGQFSYQRKFNADFAVEMSRSVRRMIQSWTGCEIQEKDG